MGLFKVVGALGVTQWSGLCCLQYLSIALMFYYIMDNICHDHKLLEESTLTAAEAYLTFSMESERRN